MIAVQAGDALRAQQVERLTGQGTEVHLIAEGDDPLRMMALRSVEGGFEAGQVAVDVGNEGDAHGFLLSPANCADSVIMV